MSSTATQILYNTATTRFRIRREIRDLVQYSSLLKSKCRPFASIAKLVLAALIVTGCTNPSEAEVPAADLDPIESPKLKKILPITENLNIIVVSFDAMRPDVLAPYGGSRAATPNFSNFAERSIVFENAYSVAPVTPTSFAAFFSGMLPTRVFHAWRFEADLTLAGELSRAGYVTAAFVNNVQLTPERGFGKGFDLYEWRRNDPDEDFIQEVSAWIENSRDRKFFVWVHFLHPHAPYSVEPGAQPLYTEEDFGRFAKTTGASFEATDDNEIARIRDLYLGEVWTADRLFGQLIDRIQQIGLLQSSVVVLTSDHGEEFSEHGEFQHGRLYEEHLRIPLILYHPQGTPGRIEDVRFQSIDLFPTLLHLAGQPIERALDGEDLLLHSNSLSPPPVVGIAMSRAKGRLVSILDGSRKLIVTCNPERHVELFDIEIDPLEKSNIANMNEDIVAKLFQMLRARLGGAPCKMMERASRGVDQTEGLDTKSLEALRALGYIE